MTSVRDIPTAHTPPGGYGAQMPPPVLAGCDDPVVAGAPDLRGLWRVAAVDAADPLADDHPVHRHVERIEQAGRRVVVTSSGVVHDMVADGSYEHGVNDVAAADLTTPIAVAATFEDGALVLRPRGLPGAEVRRWRDGDDQMWQNGSAFIARLERVTPDGDGRATR